MNKSLIKRRFTNSLKTYNDNARAQIQMAKKLVSLIGPNRYKSVLELGCGTGIATSELCFDNIEVFDAVDIVPGCKEYLSKISDKINFICDDIEKFVPDKKYDLIVSNATIQWVENLSEFIDKYMECLAPGGVFGFTIFGKKNYIEMENFIKGGLLYYSKNDVKKLFDKYKIKYIDEEVITLKFPSVKDVLYHIKNTGVNALYETHWTKSKLLKFEREYPINAGEIELTYNPIYVVLSN